VRLEQTVDCVEVEQALAHGAAGLGWCAPNSCSLTARPYRDEDEHTNSYAGLVRAWRPPSHVAHA